MEEAGSSDLLVVQGKAEEIEAHIKKFYPLVYDHLPITLEEIFMYKTEGDTNETD
jgi:ABC-2 type transport system ATP-binding protein